MPTIQDALDQVWSDEGLKKRLMTDPKPVLAEFGLQIPANVKIQVHENTAHLVNAVLGEKPDDPSAVQGNDPVAKIAQRAWTDSAFKARLLANPKDTAQEMGLKLSPEIDLKVWENTPSVHHMVLPVNPAAAELSDTELETIAGGGLSKGAQPNPVACAAYNNLAMVRIPVGMIDLGGLPVGGAASVSGGGGGGTIPHPGK